MNNDPVNGREFLGAGLAFPMRVDSQGRIAMNSLDDHVRQSILLILQTAKGERLMRSDFGSGLHRLVFSPLHAATATLVQHQVKDALTRFEPRIDVLDLTVEMDPSPPSSLMINLRYRVRSTDTMFNLVFPFLLEKGLV